VSPDPDERYSDEACSVIDSLEQIGSQWRLVVLHDLQEGEKRFNELKRSTDASSRTLSRVLDDLQELGFVNRRLEEDAPVATYYSLTAKGESLCPVFDEIEAWAEEWLDAPPAGRDPGDAASESDGESEAETGVAGSE
jgi:DNA-binding HxlR family transcriptional regulator